MPFFFLFFFWGGGGWEKGGVLSEKRAFFLIRDLSRDGFETRTAARSSQFLSLALATNPFEEAFKLKS